MNKFILLILSFFCCSMLQAQVALQRGTKLLNTSGNLSIGFKGAGSNIGLNLKNGWFLSSKAVLGANVGANIFIYDEEATFTYNVGAFGRYYFSNTETARTLFFFEGGLGYGAQPDGSSLIDSEKGVLLNIGPGLGFRIGQNVMLEAALPYQAFIVPDYGTMHGLKGTLGISMILP